MSHHDVRTELPGFVVNTHDALINKIQDIAIDNFSINPDHQQQAAQFFTYKDQGNCKRVYQAIRQL